MLRKFCIKTQSGGFTLLETLIALGIFVALVSVATVFFIQGYRLNNFGSELDLQVKSARDGLEVLTKETREAIDSDRGDYLIEEATAQTLTFYSDIDGDGSAEKIRYFLNGTDLQKGVIDPTGSPPQYLSANEVITTIATYVNNGATAIFTYLDGNNNQLTLPVDKNRIRLIHIYLKVDIQPGKSPQQYDLETEVQIRNLKNNL
jgi:type II secretory pathway pseudopilin PulG